MLLPKAFATIMAAAALPFAGWCRWGSGSARFTFCLSACTGFHHAPFQLFRPLRRLRHLFSGRQIAAACDHRFAGGSRPHPGVGGETMTRACVAGDSWTYSTSPPASVVALCELARPSRDTERTTGRGPQLD